MQSIQLTTRCLVAMLSLAGAAAVHAQQAGGENCGPITNAFGPFDYRVERGNNLNLVEGAHFTPGVEALVSANTGYIGGDLDYTLRAFPNHHRALMSVMRYGEKKKNQHPTDLRYSVECYFERAIRFRPDDDIARMLYSMYLTKGNRTAEAIQQLDIAAANAEGKDNPFTHYNLGLSYTDLKEYAKAEAQAHKAYAMGFLQPELKNRLKALGKWTDAPTDNPEDSAAAPADAASAAK